MNDAFIKAPFNIFKKTLLSASGLGYLHTICLLPAAEVLTNSQGFYPAVPGCSFPCVCNHLFFTVAGRCPLSFICISDASCADVLITFSASYQVEGSLI